MRNVIRTLAAATAGAGCIVSAAACAASPRVGLPLLGAADPARAFQVTNERSVAVAFTARSDGQISAVSLVASRVGAGPVGILAYLVTPQDPGTGGPAKPVAAPAGAEPGCWGSVTDAALSSSPQPLTIYGTACSLKAGHTYYIQLATALSPANIYARANAHAHRVLVRSSPAASWQAANVTGGLEVSPVTHATP